MASYPIRSKWFGWGEAPAAAPATAPEAPAPAPPPAPRRTNAQKKAGVK